MERVCTKEDNAIFFRANEKWVDLREDRYQIHPLFLHATNTRGTHAHLITTVQDTKIITKQQNSMLIAISTTSTCVAF